MAKTITSRTLWQSKFYIEQNPSGSLDSLTNKPDFETADIGVEGTGAANGKFVLLLENSPNIVSFPNIINETELATGRSDRHTVEYEATVHEASPVTLEGNANSYVMSLFLWSLFQKGASENTASGTVTMTCIPYDDPTPEMYFSLVKLMGSAGTNINADTLSHYKTGCIVQSLTITGEERGLIKYSAEVLGAVDSISSTDLGTAAAWSGLAHPVNTTSWKYQDFDVEMDGTAVNVKGMNLTFNNNLIPVYFDTGAVAGYRLQRCTVEGTLDLPWGITTKGANTALALYKAGTDFTLEFFTTDGAVAHNAVDIALNLIIDEFDMSDDPEIASVLTFHGVFDGSNASMDVRVGYDATYLDHSVP